MMYTSTFKMKNCVKGSRLILTTMESVGVPEDVSTTKPATERRKAARAKTEFKLVNGIRMTLIGCGMTQGFTLLLLLLALFTLATTWRNVSSTLYSQPSKRIIYHSLALANKRGYFQPY